MLVRCEVTEIVNMDFAKTFVLSTLENARIERAIQLCWNCGDDIDAHGEDL